MKKPFLFSAAALLLLTGAAAPESPEYTVSKHHNGPELYYCYADTAGNRLNDVRYAEAHPFCGDRALVRETKSTATSALRVNWRFLIGSMPP